MDCTDGLDDWVDLVIAPDKFAPVKQKIKKVSPRWNGIKRFHWTGWAGRPTQINTDKGKISTFVFSAVG
jgi:hypothetical protein